MKDMIYNSIYFVLGIGIFYGIFLVLHLMPVEMEWWHFPTAILLITIGGILSVSLVVFSIVETMEFIAKKLKDDK